MPSSRTITYADTVYFFALLNSIQNAREVIEVAMFLIRTDYEGGKGKRSVTPRRAAPALGLTTPGVLPTVHVPWTWTGALNFSRFVVQQRNGTQVWQELATITNPATVEWTGQMLMGGPSLAVPPPRLPHDRRVGDERGGVYHAAVTKG